jgi:hypothetical protein
MNQVIAFTGRRIQALDSEIEQKRRKMLKHYAKGHQRKGRKRETQLLALIARRFALVRRC